MELLVAIMLVATLINIVATVWTGCKVQVLEREIAELRKRDRVTMIIEDVRDEKKRTVHSRFDGCGNDNYYIARAGKGISDNRGSCTGETGR